MGNKILIYDSGQTYEIDEEMLYIPTFLRSAITKKITQILPNDMEFQLLDNKTMYDIGISKKLELIKEDENKWVNEANSQG